MCTVTLAHLSVEIKGTNYGIEILTADETTTGNRIVRLTQANGKVYDVEQGTERLTCTCPDFEFRHAALPFSDGCKHCVAMTSLGFVESVKPWEVNEADMEPEMGVTGMWFEPNTIESAPPAPLSDAAQGREANHAQPARAFVHQEVGTVEEIGLVAQVAINDVWFAATRELNAPRLTDITGAIVDGLVSIPNALDDVAKLLSERRVAGGLELVISELTEDHENCEKADSAEKAASIAPKPPAKGGRRGRPTLAYEVDWSELGRRYASGEGYRLLAEECGIGASTMYNRLRAMGYRTERVSKVAVCV